MVKISELITLNTKLVLASKSPRRIKLLRDLGFTFDVIPSDFDESSIAETIPNECVMILAKAKAKNVAEKLNYKACVIGADTTVYLDDEYLHKPTSSDDAFNILKKLSGRTHKVFTGIAIIYDGKEYIDYQETNVTFRQLLDDEIYSYIKSGFPMDKAGAYGIQDDFGAVFVEHIEGCYYNIVGLPIELLYKKLREITNER